MIVLQFDWPCRRVMLPMVLKRFVQGPGGATSPAGSHEACRREVMIPLRMDCSNFVTPGGSMKVSGMFDVSSLSSTGDVCTLRGRRFCLGAVQSEDSHAYSTTSCRIDSASGAENSPRTCKGITPTTETSACKEPYPAFCLLALTSMSFGAKWECQYYNKSSQALAKVHSR